VVERVSYHATKDIRMPITRTRHFSAVVAAPKELSDLPDFQPNPGGLAGQVYVPDTMVAGAPLVIVLHGCTQNAADFADAAGWFALADRHGFAVLLPQQQRANNFTLCFNWFKSGDIRRGQGEAASIMAMTASATARYDIDTERVFITGLSAGAAMAGAMLATYPEHFAGGGLIAGMPHGTATSVMMAMLQMRTATRETAVQLGERIHQASNNKGRWPKISIWHGSVDPVVTPDNGKATLVQWLAVHGLGKSVPTTEKTSRLHRRVWHDTAGCEIVEHVEVYGMGHGTPIDSRAADAVGKSAPYVLDVGVSSSSHLIEYWGIADRPTESAHHITEKHIPSPQRYEFCVERIINEALRSAGFMK
jgi:poly(hydroxyalkanoate) depolymerase family esterase